MPLTDQQKKMGLIGAGVVFVGWMFLRSKKASAAEMPPVVNVNVLPIPAAGGGMPSPTAPATKDAATGTVIAGPSTPIVAPTGGADTMHTTQTNESWANLASRAYGDYRWWPYLWDYNRTGSTQLENPDDLKRGISIKIPMAPPNDTGFKNAIFSRAESHRAYWVNKAKGGRPRPYPKDVLERTPVPTFSAPPPPPPVMSSADQTQSKPQSVAGLACLGCGPGYRMQGLGRFSRY